MAAAGIITSSKPFQACVKEQKYHYSYRHLHDGSGSLIKPVVRLKLNIARTLSDSDALVALSGLAVAFFTFTLWRSTHRLYEAGERQIAVAKQAANAATMAANASMVQERPHLFLSLNREAVGYVEPGRVMFPRIEYAFMNYGRSPAIIDRYYIEMKKAKGVKEFTESNHLRAYFDRITLPNASTGKLYIEVVPPLSEADREEILTGSTFVFLYGWINMATCSAAIARVTMPLSTIHNSTGFWNIPALSIIKR